MSDPDHDASIFHAIARRLLGPAPSPKPYRAFTSEYDRQISAHELDDVLGRLSNEEAAEFRLTCREFEVGLAAWKTRMNIGAAEASARILARVQPSVLEDTVVSLLFDQSGSMRGQKMVFAAASADICQEFLRHLGVRVEVLGFTTVKWRGGAPRKQWIRQGRRHGPGRLNELLHIVYRPADDLRASAGDTALCQMLRPDLPKENIDGEALEWAASRLRARPEHKKILVVISDGAPVDDATLDANGLTFLPDHLRSVVRAIEAGREIRLAAIGIADDVENYYSTTQNVALPIELGDAMLGLLERFLEELSFPESP